MGDAELARALVHAEDRLRAHGLTGAQAFDVLLPALEERLGLVPPTPYTIGPVERTGYESVDPLIAEDHGQQAVLTFDNLRLVADRDDHPDIVLDGIAVLERCDRTISGETDTPPGVE